MSILSLSLPVVVAALNVLQVDPYSHHVYTATNRPHGAVATTTLKSFAARGEIESASFTVTPDADLADFLLVAGDLASADGATIAADAVDVAVVKTMWEPGAIWYSTWRGRPGEPTLYNDLICHDDDLLRRDDAKQTNLLRIDSPEPVGRRYVDMREDGRKSEFNYEIMPVRDTPKMVPMRRLAADRYQQFWLTYRVPAAARPGVYRGRLTATAGGRAVGEIGLELTVYPFELPEARTHYDTSRPFGLSVYCSPDVSSLLAQAKDLAKAERTLRNIYRNMAEHNVSTLFSPRPKADSDQDPGVRSLVIARQSGLRMRPVMAAVGDAYDGWAVPMGGRERPDLEREREGYAQSLEAHRKSVAFGERIYDRILGHHEAVYFCPDECGVGTYNRLYGYMDNVHALGQKVYGDYAAHQSVGWALDVNAIAAHLSHTEAWKWHAAGAEATTYAAPFFGCLCPDTWRRQKGLRLYFSDYDGMSEYSFEFGANRWNKFTYRDTPYGPFGIVYRTDEGILDTCAWEGLREAYDDVRYYSLLRLRAEAAMASADPAVAALGRADIAWFDSHDPEQIFDLDAFRAEVAARIVALIEKVGPETSSLLGSKAPPELAPDEDATDAVAAGPDAIRELGRLEARDRWDLALKLAARLRADTSLDGELRAEAAEREAKYLGHFRRREEAVRRLADFAAEKGLKQGVTGRLLFAQVRAMLTDVAFEEQYTDAQLAAARAVLDRALGIASVPAAVRGEAVVSFAAACCNAHAYRLCVEFLDGYVRNDAFAKFYGPIRAWRARAYAGQGEYAKAVGDYKIAIWDYQYDTYRLYDELGPVAEKADDYVTAQKAYGEWLPKIDKKEAKAQWTRASQGLQRCTKKLGQKAKKQDRNVFEESDESDALGGLSLDEG